MHLRCIRIDSIRRVFWIMGNGVIISRHFPLSHHIEGFGKCGKRESRRRVGKRRGFLSAPLLWILL